MLIENYSFNEEDQNNENLMFEEIQESTIISNTIKMTPYLFDKKEYYGDEDEIACEDIFTDPQNPFSANQLIKNESNNDTFFFQNNYWKQINYELSEVMDLYIQ